MIYSRPPSGKALGKLLSLKSHYCNGIWTQSFRFKPSTLSLGSLCKSATDLVVRARYLTKSRQGGWLTIAGELFSCYKLNPAGVLTPLMCVCVCVCYMTIEGTNSQLPGFLATATTLSPGKACSSWCSDDSAAWFSLAACWSLARIPVQVLTPLFGSVISRWHQQINSWILLALAFESSQQNRQLQPTWLFSPLHLVCLKTNQKN